MKKMKNSKLKIRKPKHIPKIKEYGIISQWVLIYKSKSFSKVMKMIEEGNEEHYANYTLSLERWEKPVDNELFLIRIYEDEN